MALSDVRSGRHAVARQRSETPVYLRTEVKQRLMLLREQLPERDQMLLELRLVQRFSIIASD